MSPIAAIAPFSPYDRYAPFMAPCNADHDHASVATPGGDGVATNFNFECFIPVFDQAGADAWAVIRAHPGDYASGRWWSLRQTFVIGPDGPSSESGFVRMLDRVYSIVRVDVVVPSWSEGWGDEAYAALFGGESDLGLVPLVLYPVVIVSGCRRGWRAVRGTSSRLGPDLAWALAAITVSWTVAAGVFGELGEQARFRAMVDPITWVLAGVVLVPWLVGTVGPWISANCRTSSSARTASATGPAASRRRSRGWPRRSASSPRRSARASRRQQLHEFGDVLAWVASLANQMGIDLDGAVERYADGLPPLRPASRAPASDAPTRRLR